MEFTQAQLEAFWGLYEQAENLDGCAGELESKMSSLEDKVDELRSKAAKLWNDIDEMAKAMPTLD